ncbi:MAG TPA: nuclear transport factor 2 family protein [Limnobacter sp.]|uniref:YybH family protein n=1 Tax=Limnobacter sp. TaxID=2003368 RepID=UPI002E377407|nr:nuclear transport factor 2 family protein [Limnobacter sp.]HEX5485614.1 nuclear transport factor 2 family protein [Limnobacter sp.]
MPRNRVIHSSPQDIEQAFYEALESADLEALMDLWADDEQVVCIHPGGPRVEGYHDVRESWKEILSAGALQIRIVPLHRVEGVVMSVHNIIEQVVMSGGRGEPQIIQVNATNVYRKGPNGWRMVLHHASPALDSEELAEDDLSEFDSPPTLH